MPSNPEHDEQASHTAFLPVSPSPSVPPITPRREATRRSASQTLQSTTLSTPMSNRSGAIRETNLATGDLIRCYKLACDIDDFYPCPVESLLTWALGLCKDTSPSERESVRQLKDCLVEMQKVCRDDAVIEQLKAYCVASSETKRYGPFVKMCNKILKLTEAVKIPGIRDVDDETKPLLVRSDERQVEGSTTGIIKKPDICFVSLKSAKNLYAPLLEDDSQEIWESCAFKFAPQPVSDLERLIPKQDAGPHDGNFRSSSKTKGKATVVCDRTTRSQSISRSKAGHSSELPHTAQPTSRPMTAVAARREGSESFGTPAMPSPPYSSTERLADGDKLPRVHWSLPSLKVLGAVELKRLKDRTITEETFYHDKLEKLGVKGIGGAYRAAYPQIAHSGGQSRASATEVTAASVAPETSAQEAIDSAKQSSRGTKRKAEGKAKDEAENVDLAGSFKKLKLGINAFTTIPEVVQLAMYGTQLLCAGPTTHRAINWLVQDQVVRVWIYDRQGAIQCEGIDIVKNLDYLAVLLFALQRFRASDWGHLDRFSYDDRPASGLPGWILRIPVRGDDQKQLDLRLDAKEIGRVPSGIAGRFTRAFYVECQGFEDDPIMVKLSSIGAGRDDEAGFVQQAVAVAEDQKDHLPDLVGYHRFEETRTGDLRMALGIQGKDAEGGGRVLWALAFKRLEPICRLQGKELLIAFLDCLECHHDLYKKGILHRDISTGNLMYRLKKTADGPVVCGVLNDFDLAKYRDRAPKPSGMERTGTLPYMALDLLAAPDGSIEHLYRHDLESYIWVFLDLATSYLNGQPRSEPPLQQWFSVHTYHAMYAEKQAFITGSTWDKIEEAASENGLVDVLRELLLKLRTVTWDIANWRLARKRRRPALPDTKENNLLRLSQLDSTVQPINPTEPQEPYSSEDAMDELYGELVEIIQISIDTWQEPCMSSRLAE